MTGWLRTKTGWKLLAQAARLADVVRAVEEVIRKERIGRQRVRLSLDDKEPRPSTALRLPRPGQHTFGASTEPVRRRCRNGHR
jgi:hypothetical protein